MPILSVSKSYSRDEPLSPSERAVNAKNCVPAQPVTPAVSHTFIFNEITQLRKEGFDISTASVNACDRPVSKLPESELAEQSATFS